MSENIISDTINELIVAVLTEALLMNASLAMRVLAMNVLVLTNSPNMEPLIVLIVSELMTASLRARERRVRELIFKELNEPLSPENLVAESSFAAKELMVTNVSTNTASLTIKELIVIEEAEPFLIVSSLAAKELTKT